MAGLMLYLNEDAYLYAFLTMTRKRVKYCALCGVKEKVWSAQYVYLSEREVS